MAHYQTEAPGAGLNMLYLCGCAMNGITPSDERLRAMELAPLYAVSCQQSLAPLVASALESCKDRLIGENDEILRRFSAAKDQAVRKNLMFDTERSKLFAFMEENGIWYMPLKGIIIKDLYPRLGLRQMSDNDILFDINKRAQVRDYFADCGYQVSQYGCSKHDIYHKAPLYNFEMHVQLFDHEDLPLFRDYYADVEKRLLPLTGTACGRRFSWEDMYCHFVCHAYMHLQDAGLGLRFWCDLWMLLKHRRADMDWSYIEEQMRRLQIADFERESRELADAVFTDVAGFDPQMLPPKQHGLLMRVLGSGTYGNAEQRLSKSIARKGGKFGYVVSCVFPARETLESYYPPCKERGILLPIAWFYRLWLLLFRRPGKIKTRMKAIRDSREEDIRE